MESRNNIIKAILEVNVVKVKYHMILCSKEQTKDKDRSY